MFGLILDLGEEDGASCGPPGFFKRLVALSHRRRLQHQCSAFGSANEGELHAVDTDSRSDVQSNASLLSTQSLLSDQDTVVVDIGHSSELCSFSFKESCMDEFSHRISGLSGADLKCERDKPWYDLSFLLSLRYVRNNYEVLNSVPDDVRQDVLLEHMVEQEKILQLRRIENAKQGRCFKHVEELDAPMNCVVKVQNLSTDAKWFDIETFCKHQVAIVPKTVRVCRRKTRTAPFALLVFNSADEVCKFLQNVPEKPVVKGHVLFFETFSPSVGGFSVPAGGEPRIPA